MSQPFFWCRRLKTASAAKKNISKCRQITPYLQNLLDRTPRVQLNGEPANFIFALIAPVAQWIEQWIPNPCAASSILAGGTRIPQYIVVITFRNLQSGFVEFRCQQSGGAYNFSSN